jgi:hypothetical protein
LGAAVISLYDSGSASATILEGNYSVLLQSSFPGGLVTASIRQDGTVPVAAQSIRYLSKPVFSTVAISFAGELLPTVILGGSADTFLILGADISGYGFLDVCNG